MPVVNTVPVLASVTWAPEPPDPPDPPSPKPSDAVLLPLVRAPVTEKPPAPPPPPIDCAITPCAAAPDVHTSELLSSCTAPPSPAAPPEPPNDRLRVPLFLARAAVIDPANPPSPPPPPRDCAATPYDRSPRVTMEWLLSTWT